MRRLFSSKKVRIFLLWYFCIIFLASSVVTTNYVKIVKEGREAYLQDIKKEAQHIMRHFSQNFSLSVNSCNSIFSSQWYNHYRNNYNIYEKEFDGMKRIQIQNDILAKVTSLSYVSDILVVSPPPLNSIITKNGWFSHEDYAKIYGDVKIYYPGDNYTVIPQVTSANDFNCVLTLQDTTSRLLQGVNHHTAGWCVVIGAVDENHDETAQANC